MTAAHRTLPFGTALTVQRGGRSIQVTVTDRGPFNGAFLDLSPAAASARLPLLTATVVQMGSGETVVASPGRQRPVAAAAMPLFFWPTGDVPNFKNASLRSCGRILTPGPATSTARSAKR